MKENHIFGKIPVIYRNQRLGHAESLICLLPVQNQDIFQRVWNCSKDNLIKVRKIGAGQECGSRYIGLKGM